MWRLLSPAFLPVLLAVALYLVSPLLAAQLLQRAIAQRDLARIESKVDWSTLRASLKRSINSRLGEAAAHRPAQRSLVQRISYKLQDSFAPGMVERMIEREATPAGFVRYFAAPVAKPASLWGRVSVRRSVIAGAASPAAAASSQAMLGRIRNPRFQTPLRFAFEVADRQDAGRIYHVEFHLGASFWKLARVEVLTLGNGLTK